jgi:hypothetical protein
VAEQVDLVGAGAGEQIGDEVVEPGVDVGHGVDAEGRVVLEHGDPVGRVAVAGEAHGLRLELRSRAGAAVDEDHRPGQVAAAVPGGARGAAGGRSARHQAENEDEQAGQGQHRLPCHRRSPRSAHGVVVHMCTNLRQMSTEFKHLYYLVSAAVAVCSCSAFRLR